MTPVGYIISVAALESNRQVIQTVLEIAGQGQVLLGQTRAAISTHLFIIPAGKESDLELATQLQEVPGLTTVSIIPFSKPTQATELSMIREIFADLDYDASSVSDDDFSLFIDSKLEGQYTYYIDRDPKPNEKGLFYMHIKHLKDHPQYSPDWFTDAGRTKEEEQDTVQYFGDIEMHEVVVQLTRETHSQLEPPTPPPSNLAQMTDAQIRHWMKKNHSRGMEDKDIEIKRTSEELTVTIKRNGVTETMSCKLKK